MTGSSTRLARRRAKLRTARQAAQAATEEVGRLDVELTFSAGRTAALRAELGETPERADALRRSIEATLEYQSKLRTGREQAVRDLVKARERAATAERRYDRAILAELIEREKQRDLAEHAGRGPTSAGNG
ncbi:MAG TPA: hypothetical protein VGH99_01445 [Pseudonocardia sp.]